MNLQQVQAKLEKAAQTYRENLEIIRDDDRLSDAAKIEDLERIWTEAHNSWTTTIEQYRSTLQQRLNSTKQEAFKTPTVDTMSQTRNIDSYRDALHRVDLAAEHGDVESVRELMSRAILVGDKFQARAALMKAWDRGWNDIVNLYDEAYPSDHDNLVSIVQVEEESNRLGELGPTLHVGVPEPEKPMEIMSSSERVAAFSGGSGWQLEEGAEPVPSGMETSTVQVPSSNASPGSLESLLDSISTEAPEAPEEATEGTEGTPEDS